jgi:hypothetical protein
VPNKTGVNRLTWDFRENGPTQWMGAAREEYRGPKTGALVVPGMYTVRVVLSGQTLSQTFAVRADPRTTLTQADFESGYAFAKKYMGDYSKIDDVLNNLDAIKKSLNAASASVKSDPALSAQIAAAMKTRDDVFATFTADYHNDEDSIQRPGALREDVPGGYFLRGDTPPTAVISAYATQFDTAYDEGIAKYDAFVKSLVPLSQQLQAKGLKPVDGATVVSR